MPLQPQYPKYSRMLLFLKITHLKRFTEAGRTWRVLMLEGLTLLKVWNEMTVLQHNVIGKCLACWLFWKGQSPFRNISVKLGRVHNISLTEGWNVKQDVFVTRGLLICWLYCNFLSMSVRTLYSFQLSVLWQNPLSDCLSPQVCSKPLGSQYHWETGYEDSDF